MIDCKDFTKTVVGKPEARRKNVHIVIKGGFVVDAYANCDVDVIVYDLDTQDPDMREEIEKSVAQLADHAHEVEVY